MPNLKILQIPAWVIEHTVSRFPTAPVAVQPQMHRPGWYYYKRKNLDPVCWFEFPDGTAWQCAPRAFEYALKREDELKHYNTETFNALERLHKEGLLTVEQFYLLNYIRIEREKRLHRARYYLCPRNNG